MCDQVSYLRLPKPPRKGPAVDFCNFSPACMHQH
jgi:hypothetical protein